MKRSCSHYSCGSRISTRTLTGDQAIVVELVLRQDVAVVLADATINLRAKIEHLLTCGIVRNYAHSQCALASLHAGSYPRCLNKFPRPKGRGIKPAEMKSAFYFSYCLIETAVSGASTLAAKYLSPSFQRNQQPAKLPPDVNLRSQHSCPSSLIFQPP